MLELDSLIRLEINKTTNGKKITKAVDMVNTAHQELLNYGKFRIMSAIPYELYGKVRKQEALVHDSFNKALNATKTDIVTVQSFVKSCMSLITGYKKVIQTARDRGLSKLDIDFFCLECSDGREIYVTPTEDMKAVLRGELNSDNLCIYSMDELAILLSDDKIAYELKTKFDATLTGSNKNDKATTH